MLRPHRSSTACVAVLFSLAVLTATFVQPTPACALTQGQGIAGVLGGLIGAVLTAVLATQFAPLGLVAGAVLGSSLGVWIGGVIGGGAGSLQGPFGALGGLIAGAAMGLVLGPIAGALLGWHFAWFGGIAGALLGYKFGNRIIGLFQGSPEPLAPRSSMPAAPEGSQARGLVPLSPLKAPAKGSNRTLSHCKARLDETREALSQTMDEGSQKERSRALDEVRHAQTAYDAAFGSSRPIPAKP